ncbi:NmrA family protein [Streptomyces inusitatus]|uniref:NmrA family protein n=1 Tax=Streptomyces inusitatus TaxID=68221 RepID=A0A918UTU0_9ACTN|nr:NmrA family protein [Streptomyces inusitatus]
MLGATGKTGRRLVPLLRAAGHRVRAASRSGEVTFDWDRPDTWAPALDGANTVQLVAPEDPEPVGALVRQAVAGGVTRFVVLSGRGIEHSGDSSDFGAGMAEAERAVRESGVEWTVIRPNNFNQNFDEDLWGPPVRSGRLALPAGSVPEPFVDVSDVAEVSAVLLTATGDEHHGRIYELSGPRALTFGEAVETMARAAGRPVVFEELTPDAYVAELRAAGVPESFVTALDSMFTLFRAGHTSAPADGVPKLLGRPARSFEEYAAGAAAAGAWS